jgi:hypothetical protein
MLLTQGYNHSLSWLTCGPVQTSSEDPRHLILSPLPESAQGMDLSQRKAPSQRQTMNLAIMIDKAGSAHLALLSKYEYIVCGMFTVVGEIHCADLSFMVVSMWRKT